MFIKDTSGNWYEVPEDILKSKRVDEQKAREAIVAERAEKRKKIVDLIARLDEDDIRILREQLGMKPGWTQSTEERRPKRIGPYYYKVAEGDCDCDCHCDCDCRADCDCYDCDAGPGSFFRGAGVSRMSRMRRFFR